MTEDVASLFPSRWLHPLAPLKRLSPVNLLAANGFDKPFAASKFELCVENNPPYDCNHAEDSLFYEHRSIAGGLFIFQSGRLFYSLPHTLPGLSRFLGSKTALMPRISSMLVSPRKASR